MHLDSLKGWQQNISVCPRDLCTFHWFLKINGICEISQSPNKSKFLFYTDFEKAWLLVARTEGGGGWVRRYLRKFTSEV